MYTQNKEQEYILEYFKDFKGTLLDIGANDGKTFSNSLALIEQGWNAVLVEPSPCTFEKLSKLHAKNKNVTCLNVAIGTDKCKMKFYESGHHLKDKSDYALLSTLDANETIKWRKAGIEFKEIDVDVITMDEIKGNFDFITIDAEGLDIDILKQIDLTNTKLLCIEWNSIIANKLVILEYCSQFGMNKIIYESCENLLICRKQN